MADRGTVNLFAGLRESWRMTAANQWRIMGYLALIGVVLCVVFFVFAVIAGAGMMAGMSSGGAPQMGVGTMLFTLVVSIPFAYLTVLVPAGIYRELRGPGAAEVFA
jgi:heme/copper-type cytochrome/quinol oxidase subunit 2